MVSNLQHFGQSMPETKKHIQNKQQKDCKSPKPEQVPTPSLNQVEEKTFQEAKMIGNRRKLTVLYHLLSACLAHTLEDDRNSEPPPRGVAVEVVISCSAVALLQQGDGKDNQSASDDSWEKWKRGGHIRAAAITGGTLMAITGGLAPPAIASGVGALAPTLGTIMPVIGAGGFAAFASAAGSVAGSVAVAASFGAAGAGLTGTNMARRMESVDEFEFKVIGENHNQGVSSSSAVGCCGFFSEAVS